jgi:hypothetical protein
MGLTLAPNGHLVVAVNDSINADPNQPSELVEFTTLGGFVRRLSIDPNIDGPFGIAAAEFNEPKDLAFLNDNHNTLGLVICRVTDTQRRHSSWTALRYVIIVLNSISTGSPRDNREPNASGESVQIIPRVERCLPMMLKL